VHKNRAAWAALAQDRTGARAPPGRFGERPGRHGNRITYVDGIRFTSRLEADRYCELKILKAGGEVLWFTRQVTFDIAPGVVYRCDFLVAWNRSGLPGTCMSIEDTKGHMTQTSRVKIAAVQQRHGIAITLLRREQVGRFTR
jgi:uncharacterized protein DUF1064